MRVQRFAIVLGGLLAGCGGETPPAAFPPAAAAPSSASASAPASASASAPAPASASAPTPTYAPRAFTAAQLHAGMPVGLVVVYEFRAYGAAPYQEVWTVTAADAESLTIGVVKIAADGTREAKPAQTSRWAEVADHGLFPAETTTVSASTATVPAGTFATRLYTVTDAEGVQRLHFADAAPGPPVHLQVEREGTVVMELVLISREQRK